MNQQALGIKDVLDLREEGIELASGPAKLFRLMMLDLNMSYIKLDRLIDEYLRDPVSGYSESVDKHSYVKANLKRAMATDTMGWSILKSAIYILKPLKVIYELDLEWDPNIQHPTEVPSRISLDGPGNGTELCNLYRMVASKIRLYPKTWSGLVSLWINDPRSGVKQDPVSKSTERGNLRQQIIESNEFTWDLLMKALTITGVMKCTFRIKLHHSNKSKSITEHAVAVTLREAVAL